MLPRAAEDSFKGYAINAARLSTEAAQYLIGARPELIGKNRTTPDGVFVYKRRGESEARVLVVELKYSAKARPPPSDKVTAKHAVSQIIENKHGTTAKEYAEAVTGSTVDPSRLTLLGFALRGVGLGPSKLRVKFHSVSLVRPGRIVSIGNLTRTAHSVLLT